MRHVFRLLVLTRREGGISRTMTQQRCKSRRRNLSRRSSRSSLIKGSTFHSLALDRLTASDAYKPALVLTVFVPSNLLP